ncbi:MAG: right-handed parallel beta-helix repeat-containing protein, partial [Candidatus Aegiribacteria sp.]|nr:right-handed parallel beta-helix repeat-containing protein [Candidatus Aegiribacteria sp.]
KDGSCSGVISNNSVYGLDRLGIYVVSWNKATNNISVYDNLVYNCDGDGFSAAAESAGVLSDVQFYNNLAYNNTGNGITVGAWGEPGVNHPIDGITIINNTFVGNGEASWGCGVSVENAEADNIVVRNNIVSGNTTCQFNAEAFGTGFIADNNLIDGATDYYGDEYVEGDPMFTSPGSNNYHIGSASPAIDEGSQVLAPATDMDGQPRPSGSGYDIGCYEYQQ